MDVSGYDHLHLSLEAEGRLLVLTLDHGKANEMGSAQLREFEQLVKDLEADSTVRALISTSNRRSRRGTPIFIAGANVTERTSWDDDQVKHHVRWQRQVLGQLRRAPVFHVAVVGGVALGWGTEYMLTCDYRIAVEGAAFGLPETGLGILPGAGGTSELWAEVGLAHALRLGMTGERIGPAEACRIGLVQEQAEDLEQGMARARQLAALAAKASPTAVSAFKRTVLDAVGLDAEHRTEAEARAYEHCVETGQAAIGREHFAAIRKGQGAPWPQRVPWHPNK